VGHFSAKQVLSDNLLVDLKIPVHVRRYIEAIQTAWTLDKDVHIAKIRKGIKYETLGVEAVDVVPSRFVGSGHTKKMHQLD